MPIKLRKIKNKDGSTSLLLDIHHNGERKREFLNDMKLLKITSPLDRIENKERLKLAEQIKNKREQELQGNDYDITPTNRKGVDFLKFFDNYLTIYNKKDKRVINGCFGKFKEYMAETGIKSLTSKQIDENLVISFKEFLENNLHGETPANYFKKFKRVLQYAVKQKVMATNPALDITAKRNEGIKKDILTFDEIRLLAATQLTNEQVKKAFLFSCYTGLRFCDISQLKWKNIQGEMVNIMQQKTAKAVSINIHDNAKPLLGKKGKPDDYVFTLPSHNACLKNLRYWCKKAGIEKKITWHCARHSFATNIIFYGSDVNSASALLGHSSLVYTQRYVRVVASLKEKAVANLPNLTISL